VSAALRGQLIAAAAALGDRVEIVTLGGDQSAVEVADAVVVLGARPDPPRDSSGARSWPASRRGAPLVVALAPDGSSSEHVRLLGHDADVVLSANTHGRVVLATVLALLRWRAR
jgi:hypothetical protein